MVFSFIYDVANGGISLTVLDTQRSVVCRHHTVSSQQLMTLSVSSFLGCSDQHCDKYRDNAEFLKTEQSILRGWFEPVPGKHWI